MLHYIKYTYTLTQVPVESLQPPVVLVCQPDKFNYEKGKKYGYTSYTRLVKGHLDGSSIISWKGKGGNLT